MYYIVRRAFRCKEGLQLVGSIVEPASISGFKYRLGEKHILQVTEQNFAERARYFKDRYHIEIAPATEVATAKNAEFEAKEKARLAAEEHLTKRVEALKLDLPEDLTFTQVLEAVEKAEAKRDAEETAKREAEEKAKHEAEEKAKREAEEKAKREAEEKAKRVVSPKQHPIVKVVK